METLKFAVSQTDEWESAQSNYVMVEITFITNCARGHKKNALETECSPCGPGQFANAIDTHSCSACDEGTFAERIGSPECDPCSVTSFQPSKGKSECKACPMLSSTEGGATALADCMCDVGAYGKAADTRARVRWSSHEEGLVQPDATRAITPRQVRDAATSTLAAALGKGIHLADDSG